MMILIENSYSYKLQYRIVYHFNSFHIFLSLAIILGEYTWDDHIGNPGLLHSACLEGTVDPGLSVKLSVHYDEREPLAFTCNCESVIFSSYFQRYFDDYDLYFIFYIFGIFILTLFLLVYIVLVTLEIEKIGFFLCESFSLFFVHIIFKNSWY